MLTRMGSQCTRVGIQDPILNYLHEVRVGEIKAIARGEPTMLAKLLNRKKLKLAERVGFAPARDKPKARRGVTEDQPSRRRPNRR
jgi:hypothetical protein